LPTDEKTVKLISDLGGIASILGLLISIVGLLINLYVLINVKRLKGAFLFNVRADELIQDLNSYGTSLKAEIDKTPNRFSSSQAQFSMVQLDPALRNLEDMTSGATKRTVMILRDQIYQQRKRGAILQYDDARRFYNDIMMLVIDLKNAQENRRLTAQ